MCRRVWFTLVLVAALVSATVILPLAAGPSTAAAATGPANFAVRGSQILDPDGRNFIPVGANVNGPQFVWNGPTVGQAAVADDVWRWNTIRLNTLQG